MQYSFHKLIYCLIDVEAKKETNNKIITTNSKLFIYNF